MFFKRPRKGWGKAIGEFRFVVTGCIEDWHGELSEATDPAVFNSPEDA